MPKRARREPVSYNIADGRTTVPLHLEPWGTVFVVFRKPAKATSLSLPKECEDATGGGGWSVECELPAGARRASISHAGQRLLRGATARIKV